MDATTHFKNAIITTTRLKIAADKTPNTTLGATQLHAAAHDATEFLFNLKELYETGRLPGLAELRRNWIDDTDADHLQWAARRVEHALIAAHAYAASSNDADHRHRLLNLIKEAGHAVTDLLDTILPTSTTDTNVKEAA